MNRDERIESYYNWPAWDLAERIVDLEDENKELKKLQELYQDDINWLRALEAAGVDNWDGYDTANQIYKGELDEDGL